MVIHILTLWLCWWLCHNCLPRFVVSSYIEDLDNEREDSQDLWRQLLGVEMLALDATMPRHRSPDSKPPLTRSPHTGRRVDLTTPRTQQHRLFCFLDMDNDGLISAKDVQSWVQCHLSYGTLDYDDILSCKGSSMTSVGADLNPAEKRSLADWMVDGMMAFLEVMCQPESRQGDWLGVSVQQFLDTQLGHDMGTLLLSPLDLLSNMVHCDRHLGRGAHLVRWGPTSDQGSTSSLDYTAEFCA